MDTLLTLVDRIYGAALDASQWPDVLTEVAHAVGSETTVLSMHNLARRSTEFNLAIGPEPTTIALYEAHYHTMNPWFNATNSLTEGLHRGEAFVNHRDLVRTEFYNDFGKRWGIVHTAAGVISAQGSAVSYLSLNRGGDRTSFGDAELQSAEWLLPHIKRALEISRQLEFVGQHRYASDQVGTGLIWLSGARVDGLNTAAHTILASQDGIGLQGDQLAFRSSQDRERFRNLLKLVGPGRPSGTLRIRRPSGRLHYGVTVVYLPSLRMFVRQAARLVMISDPEREEGPSFDRELREAFGLSPAEAHLTGILVRGVGLPTAADELGISRHTAKAQLGAIFRKTETNSQARLIRLVLKTVSR